MGTGPLLQIEAIEFVKPLKTMRICEIVIYTREHLVFHNVTDQVKTVWKSLSVLKFEIRFLF